MYLQWAVVIESVVDCWIQWANNVILGRVENVVPLQWIIFKFERLYHVNYCEGTIILRNLHMRKCQIDPKAHAVWIWAVICSRWCVPTILTDMVKWEARVQWLCCYLYVFIYIYIHTCIYIISTCCWFLLILTSS